MNLYTFNSAGHHTFLYAEFPLCLRFLSMLLGVKTVILCKFPLSEVLCHDTATSRVVYLKGGWGWSLSHLSHVSQDAC